MNERVLISIVIPNYNGEDFLPDLMHSFVVQDYPHFEVIIVDDCSTDQSVELLKAYEQQHSFLRCIYLSENLGAGHARNEGAALATGKYLLFHDADDWLEKDALEQLAQCVEATNDPDLVVFSYTVVDENKQVVTVAEKLEQIPDRLYKGTELFYLIPHTINPAPWNKLFRKDIWERNALTFTGEIYHQDLSTIPYACFVCDTSVILKSRLYNYRKNPKGITETASDKHITSIFQSVDCLIERFHETAQTNELKDHLFRIAIEVFTFNFEYRKRLYSANQIGSYIQLFGSYITNYGVTITALLERDQAVFLLRQLLKETEERKRSENILPALDNSDMACLLGLKENQEASTALVSAQGVFESRIAELETANEKMAADRELKNRRIEELTAANEQMTSDSELKNQRIEELTKTVENTTSAIEQKDQHIASMEKSMEQKEAAIGEKERYIRELEAAKEITGKMLDEKDAYIASREAMIAESENRYVFLQGEKLALQEQLNTINQYGMIGFLNYKRSIKK